MSRRHKEKETEIQQPRMMESQGDGHQGDLLDNGSTVTESTHGIKIHLSAPKFIGSISEDTLHFAMLRTYTLAEDVSKGIHQKKRQRLHLNSHFEGLSSFFKFKSEDNGDLLNKIVEKIAKQMTAAEKEEKRGRPEIEQLSSYVDDEEVCSWTKSIYKRIFHKSISVAKNLTQYFVCFICSFFKIFKTESADGRIAHFRRMMLPHVKNMPSARALQKYYAWFAYWKAAAIKTAKELKDEAKHYAWQKLEELIYGHLVQLSVQVAK